MRHFLFLILVLSAIPVTAQAIEAPAAQLRIDAGKVLRGAFTEDHQMNASNAPLHSTGHFVVTPARGLIWNIEKPFPTATIITPNGAAQDFGGIAMKLPIKNLRRIYDMVGGALEGDWSRLETDFVITRGGSEEQWLMRMTPRQNSQAKLPYATITVSGNRFVENIVMTKADGSTDALSFSEAVLTSAPLAANESALFNEIHP